MYYENDFCAFVYAALPLKQQDTGNQYEVILAVHLYPIRKHWQWSLT